MQTGAFLSLQQPTQAIPRLLKGAYSQSSKTQMVFIYSLPVSSRLAANWNCTIFMLDLCWAINEEPWKNIFPHTLIQCTLYLPSSNSQEVTKQCQKLLKDYGRLNHHRMIFEWPRKAFYIRGFMDWEGKMYASPSSIGWELSVGLKLGNCSFWFVPIPALLGESEKFWQTAVWETALTGNKEPL